MNIISIISLILAIAGTSFGNKPTLIEVPNCRCFTLIRPVCGDDGRTYWNHCEARCQGVTKVTRGECQKEAGTSVAGFFNSRPVGCACPFIYRPVCGLDRRTYPNQCSATCRGIEISHDGACDLSEVNRGRLCRCPPISWRVCGQDNITYENACYARCKNVEIVSMEPCPGSGIEASKQLPCNCRTERKPVCGADGQTYANPCQAMCNRVGVVHKGECTSDPKACICTLQFQPVCAENGKTYANPCQANCYGQTYTEGSCEE